jgi:Trypsin-like peptidase domain
MMNRHFLNLILILSCALIPVIQASAQDNALDAQAQQTQLSPVVISNVATIVKDKAQAIAIKVFKRPAIQSPYKASGTQTDEQEIYRASGTLISKQERKYNQKSVYLYLVLTNKHVLKGSNIKAGSGNKYHIQTSDNLMHEAFLYPNVNFDFHDLGILWFYNEKSYEVAQLGQSTNLKPSQEIFVAGFPCKTTLCEEKFKFTPGRAFTQLISDKKFLDEGYQIGFTNDTADGMSGSPILDEKGLLVGINGRGKEQEVIFQPANPSIHNADPLAYSDGSKPNPELREKFAQYAWGIPVETYIRYLPKQPFDRLTPSKDYKDYKSIKSVVPAQKSSPTLTTQSADITPPKSHSALPSEGNQGLNIVVVIGSTMSVMSALYMWIRRRNNSIEMQVSRNNRLIRSSTSKENTNESQSMLEIVVDRQNQCIHISYVDGLSIKVKELEKYKSPITIGQNPQITIDTNICNLSNEINTSKELSIEPFVSGDTYKLKSIDKIRDRDGREMDSWMLVTSKDSRHEPSVILIGFKVRNSIKFF